MKKMMRFKKQFPMLVLMGITFFALPGMQTANAFFQEETQAYDQYKGEVLDADTNKELVFASLAIEGSNISTITNTEGEFS